MKKENKKSLTREDKQIISSFDEGFEFKTVNGNHYHIKPLTVGKLGLLSRITNALDDLPELETFMLMFWANIEIAPTLLKSLRNQTVEEDFYEFLEKFMPQDIENIVEITKQISDVMNSGVVEVEDSEDSEKKP